MTQRRPSMAETERGTRAEPPNCDDWRVTAPLVSFGTNHSAGVCIHFAEKVPSPLCPQQPLGAHRDRGRPRRADQRPGGRERRNIQCLLAVSRAATWIVLFDIASWRRVKRGGGWGN